MLSERALNRATLARQLLLERVPVTVPEALRRLIGLQAQAPASPWLALWNRVAGFDPAALDAAFATGEVVKATLMRITLHAVHREDYPVLHNAVLRILRAARLGDDRFVRSGLTIAEVDEFLPELIAFADRPRTVPEIEKLLAERFGGDRPGLWWALRTFAPLHHVPTGGPWSFGGRSFVAAPAGLPFEARDASTRELVRRYLAAFGPATVADMGQFTLLPRTVLRDAVRALGDELTHLPGGKLYDLPGAPIPSEDVPAPARLLPMWDNVLLAYADRTRLIPPEYRKVCIRMNGDVLPTVLVDGYVAGVWRAAPDGIEVTAFRPLTAAAWDELTAEAAALTALLADRDPLVYARYGHWWDKPLPAAETRVLPG
ncbi:winged helix DNA-binding domain-containing protein [Actinoplanes aureus]|uniref:AlkZ family DNA glycosylase n=1 Tax=Actinoplanes aureus TaxID=2792083 RepID=A0A931CAD6_9ACTN|nr:winged helix DNA-binding domain-containing protein [Actinoplanes aureus]MBG0563468.1 AlkZ family DNA glycosylase [Actinoplanes aureus]